MYKHTMDCPSLKENMIFKTYSKPTNKLIRRLSMQNKSLDEIEQSLFI